jgi:uncharacterized protein YdeI (YjbR/CyaY-like superfamily)
VAASSAATNPKVDAYIAKAAPFAKPILTHLRGLIHKACPGVAEEIKWSRPFFSYHGEIIGNVSAFKAHCSSGFWDAEIGKVLKADGVLQDGGMGSLGRITRLEDMPSDKQLIGYLRQAAAFIDAGQGATWVAVRRQVVKAPKPLVEVPEELTAALKKNKAAATAFAAFSASCKREYSEWIASAKRAETRERRVAQAIEWISEGKQRNWKYQEG